jgi:hypothetical protein
MILVDLLSSSDLESEWVLMSFVKYNLLKCSSLQMQRLFRCLYLHALRHYCLVLYDYPFFNHFLRDSIIISLSSHNSTVSSAFLGCFTQYCPCHNHQSRWTWNKWSSIDNFQWKLSHTKLHLNSLCNLEDKIRIQRYNKYDFLIMKEIKEERKGT